jgi:hypothetical protein
MQQVATIPADVLPEIVHSSGSAGAGTAGALTVDSR